MKCPAAGTVEAKRAIAAARTRVCRRTNRCAMIWANTDGTAMKTALGIASALLLWSPPVWAQAAQVVSVSDDTRFSEQAFSLSLFWQIPHGERACAFYGLTEGVCSYERRHLFQDAVLVTRKESTASIESTLIPDVPGSVNQAVAYAQILNRMGEGEGVDFTNRNVLSDQISFVGCPYVDGHLCFATLSLTEAGAVSEITVTYSTP
ncbi:MAG: hypothetical protein AAF329_28945 [Cyanobacteria bacterium P01_A01_bin.17]